jgi:outer membrane protein assembly factor BamD
MKVLSAPGALALCLTTAVLGGCATLSGEPSEPNYASDAQTNLERGVEALGNKNFLEAERYFNHVRTRYPFLDAAREAELRMADALFGREQYLEARDAYQSFIKAHPSWPQVDYAAFQVAMTHYKEIPSGFFLLPPPEEKDQTEVKNSLRAMNDFLRQYPKSQYAPRAQEVVDETRSRLARHEMYVASFYAKRERWRAVAFRYENVIRQYPGLGFDEKALFGIYDAYMRLDEKDKAHQALQEVVSRMPGTPAAQRAQALLPRT